MIHTDLVEALNDDHARLVKQAFVTIADSGVLESMQERLLTSLALGSPDEFDEALCNRIRDYRRAVNQLAEFKSISESFKKG
jgi:predicted outer membrane protein